MILEASTLCVTGKEAVNVGVPMSLLPLLLVFEVMGWKVLSNHYVTGEYLVDGIPCRQIYICGVQCQYNKLLCPG